MANQKNASEQTGAANPQAVEQIAEAHRRLTALRQQLDKHPDLEAAIERLELALSILTTKTGGML
jgi:chromosome segregation ATPase